MSTVATLPLSRCRRDLVNISIRAKKSENQPKGQSTLRLQTNGQSPAGSLQGQG